MQSMTRTWLVIAGICSVMLLAEFSNPSHRAHADEEDSPSREKADQFAAFIPIWKVGQTWKVRYRVLTPSLEMEPDSVEEIIFRYQVTGHAEIGVDDTFVVEARALTADGEVYRIHYRNRDFTIRLIEEVFAAGDARRVDTGKRGTSFLDQALHHRLILDHPQFASAAAVRSPDRRGERYQLAQKLEVGDDGRLEVTMTLTDGELPDADVVRSEQTWERGKPFWTHAEKRLGDTLLIEGTLLD